jgi:hypothetical protein
LALGFEARRQVQREAAGPKREDSIHTITAEAPKQFGNASETHGPILGQGVSARLEMEDDAAIERLVRQTWGRRG